VEDEEEEAIELGGGENWDARNTLVAVGEVGPASPLGQKESLTLMGRRMAVDGRAWEDSC
jgi:hypothetical protein